MIVALPQQLLISRIDKDRLLRDPISKTNLRAHVRDFTSLPVVHKLCYPKRESSSFERFCRLVIFVHIYEAGMCQARTNIREVLILPVLVPSDHPVHFLHPDSLPSLLVYIFFTTKKRKLKKNPPWQLQAP